MRITYFGNAMILIEGRHSRLLCDPWVTFGRHSASGLYTFPELRMTPEDVSALRPDFIYISHTHEDHFDPRTLACFSPSTPVLVADYERNFTERNIRALGFTDVRIVNGTEGMALNGADRCWIEPNGKYPEVDSLLVARLDGFTVVNMNDNPFDADQCRRLAHRFAPIDLACVPYSFQGPYPAFYENLTREERESEAAKKRERNYETMTLFAETLRPQYLFPFAAGAIYGGARAKLYPYYGVGTCAEAIAYASKRVEFKPLLLSQFCSYDFSTQTRSGGEYREVRYTDHLEYIEDIAKKPSQFDAGGHFWIAESERIDLTKLLQRARERQEVHQKRRGYVSDGAFFIDVGEPLLYRFSLSDDAVTRVAEADIKDDVYEIFRVPYSLLIGVLTGHYNWSNVKTQYVSFYRRPNVFNPDLHILMSYLQL